MALFTLILGATSPALRWAWSSPSPTSSRPHLKATCHPHLIVSRPSPAQQDPQHFFTPIPKPSCQVSQEGSPGEDLPLSKLSTHSVLPTWGQVPEEPPPSPSLSSSGMLWAHGAQGHAPGDGPRGPQIMIAILAGLGGEVSLGPGKAVHWASVLTGPMMGTANQSGVPLRVSRPRGRIWKHCLAWCF